MRYESLEPIEREAVESALREGDVRTIVAGIDYLSNSEQDRESVLDLLMRCIGHAAPEVRGAAARGMGNLVRLHPDMPIDDIVAALRERLADAEIAPYVEDALADVETAHRRSVGDPRGELVDSVQKIADGRVGDLTETLVPLGPRLEAELASPVSDVFRNQREKAEVANLLSALDAVLDASPPGATDIEVLRDPGWSRVVDAAKSALAELSRPS
ncbi:SCO4402 family protein [Actinomadura opuntiae]|uniref:SCO4402 family protein n=1 Tax=Actinomadura sp. OS1-43 TaxID=604315 RepID=UPI00255B37AF|nr:hypothetical protein [Actinomadura sp. OS1-43]MDL4820788.1 hypothetical protein [Actinomadura sp. OS1-43]